MSPRVAAVCGMNCAMPCAPAGLTAAGVEPALLPNQSREEFLEEPLSAAAWANVAQMSSMVGTQILRSTLGGVIVAGSAFGGTVRRCGAHDRQMRQHDGQSHLIARFRPEHHRFVIHGMA